MWHYFISVVCHLIITILSTVSGHLMKLTATQFPNNNWSNDRYFSHWHHLHQRISPDICIWTTNCPALSYWRPIDPCPGGWVQYQYSVLAVWDVPLWSLISTMGLYWKDAYLFSNRFEVHLDGLHGTQAITLTVLTHLPQDNLAGKFQTPIFLSGNDWILIKIPLNFVPKGSIDDKSALVQVMACRRRAKSHYLIQGRPSSPTHARGTRRRWVN